MRVPIGALAVLAVIVAAAFAAGAWWSRGTLDAPGPGDPPGSGPGTPVVALDAESVDLGPDAGLVVDWGALSPPDAALPAPGSAGASPPLTGPPSPPSAPSRGAPSR